jgi:hypothetical protein
MASPLRGGLVSNNTIITSADDDDEEFQVETMQSAQSPLNNRKTKSIFGSPAKMERFKRLIAETNGLSDAPRVGFGSISRKGSEGGEEEEKKNTGSIGAFLNTGKKDVTKKSKLSALSKKSSEAFKYVDK